jgi:hypothetical protein
MSQAALSGRQDKRAKNGWLKRRTWEETTDER